MKSRFGPLNLGGLLLCLGICGICLFSFTSRPAKTKDQEKPAVSQAGQYILHPTPNPEPFSHEFMTPHTLGQCHLEMEKMLPPKLLDEMRRGTEADMLRYQPTIGAWMQANWQEKCAGFTAVMGKSLYQETGEWLMADDVSAIILLSFWRHLHHQPIRLKDYLYPESPYPPATTLAFKKFEADSLSPKTCPDCHTKITIKGRFYHQDHGGAINEYFGTCGKEGKTWTTRPGGRWYQPNGDTRILLSSRQSRPLSKLEDQVFNGRP